MCRSKRGGVTRDEELNARFGGAGKTRPLLQRSGPMVSFVSFPSHHIHFSFFFFYSYSASASSFSSSSLSLSLSLLFPYFLTSEIPRISKLYLSTFSQPQSFPEFIGFTIKTLPKSPLLHTGLQYSEDTDKEQTAGLLLILFYYQNQKTMMMMIFLHPQLKLIGAPLTK